MFDAITAAGIFLGSYHVDRAAGYNERNPGVLVELGDWHTGAYRNSLRRTTVFLMRDFGLAERGPVRLSFQFGAASGYPSPVLGALRVSVGPVALYALPAGKNSVFGLALRAEIGR